MCVCVCVCVCVFNIQYLTKVSTPITFQQHFCIISQGIILQKLNLDIQWVWKVFRPPLIFHSLLYCSHLLKSFKFVFFSSLMYTQHPILTEKHRIVDIFADLLKKKNWNITWSSVFRPFAVTLIYLTQVLSISSDHPWDGSTPSFESSCVWLYWLDLIRKATHLSI